MRLTTRGRVVVLLLSLGLIAGGGAVLGSVAEASAPSRGVAVARHVVTSGETLWAVAREISRPGDDLRDVVADIEDLNRLSSAQLQPGQVLWLPVSTGARR
jgi:LysM repeat protein